MDQAKINEAAGITEDGQRRHNVLLTANASGGPEGRQTTTMNIVMCLPRGTICHLLGLCVTTVANTFNRKSTICLSDCVRRTARGAAVALFVARRLLGLDLS